ncbi:MAG: DUF4412 domain-containing protein [Candidatus Binatia bacterium]
MRRLSFALALVLAFSLSAHAQFEGEIHTKITTPDGTGTGTLYLSKVGVRNEMDIKSPRLKEISSGTFAMITLHKIAEPDVVYHVNPTRKTYSVINLKKIRTRTKGLDKEDYTIKRLGSDTVAGYACEHVLITSRRNEETEMCIAQGIAGASEWLATMEQSSPVKDRMMTALKEAGITGFPVKVVTREKGQQSPEMTMEVVQVNEKALPASLFTVPGDYKQENVISSFMTPEMEKKMQDAMKKLTPDQRKMYEQMMEQMGR